VRDGCTPDFFVIGAAKCGTSSLHHYLAQHPEISMSSVKEPCIFSSPRWLPSRSDYYGLLDCAAPHRGESSTSYSRYPVEGDAARLIHMAVPDAKLIYLVRDPVERLIADFNHHAAAGLERRSLDEAVKDFESGTNFYVCASCYGTQIGRYLDYFDPSRLLILQQSDLKSRRQETLRRVFSVLGVETDFWSRQFSVELLRRDDYVQHGGLNWRVRESLAGEWYRRLPLRWRLPAARTARRLLRAVPRQTLNPGLRAALSEFLAPEVDALRAYSTDCVGPSSA
jgi:hypothetical protein